MRNIFAGGLLALTLGGCAALQEQKPAPIPLAPPEAQGVTVTKEQGGRFLAFVGPQKQHAEPFLGVSDTNFFALRSWLDNKNGEVAHQLYVETSYFGAPAKWDAARDQANTKLGFVEVGQNEISCESGCSYADEFAASLPEDYLRAHRNGFAVTFSATGGQTLTVNVAPDMVAAELGAVDTVRSTIAKSAANTPAPAPAATTPPK